MINTILQWSSSSGYWKGICNLAFAMTIVLTVSMAMIQSAYAQAYSQKLLHSFTGVGADGALPLAVPLIRDSSGNLYGTTTQGGAYGLGSIFKVASNGQITILHSFSGAPDGEDPFGQLSLDSDGFLYGTTWTGGNAGDYGVVFKMGTQPLQGYSVLYRFQNQTDGSDPSSGVILDPNGNLYGVTWNGGAYGDGVLFKLAPAGELNVLYSFGANPDDGGFALGLVRDSQGTIYGTDLLGGGYANSNCLQISHVLDFGCGVVFKVDPSGQETLLHVFSGVAGDGGSPAGPPTLDSSGILYGTALVGGTGTCQGSWFPTDGCGTVFKIDTAGNYSTLYSFPGTGQNGAGPVGGLVLDSAGNMYGATEDGGVGTCNANILSNGGIGGYFSNYPGCGIAFKLSTSGTETVLHQFAGPDGGNPEAGLVMDSSGNLYGTTYDGGDLHGCGFGYGCGTVFELSPNGSLVHHSAI